MKKSNNDPFETIYRLHHPMVLQMCLGFVKGDRDTANDMSQEVFISVWNNLEKFREASTYKTWIYRITVNTCLQFVKKDKKVRILSTAETDNLMSNINQEKNLNDNTSELYDAIGQLKKIDRLIIMMVLENHHYESIAEVMGIEPINVRVKIHRIKKRLKNILKSNNDE